MAAGADTIRQGPDGAARGRGHGRGRGGANGFGTFANLDIPEPEVEPDQEAPTLPQLHQWWLHYLHKRAGESYAHLGHSSSYGKAKMTLKNHMSVWKKDADYADIIVDPQTAGAKIKTVPDAFGPVHCEQLIRLPNFGEKTVAELEQATVTWYISHDWNAPPASAFLKPGGRSARRRREDSEAVAHPGPDEPPGADTAPRTAPKKRKSQNDAGGSGEGESQGGTSTRKRCKPAKTYIPALGSGGYGIMLALWSHTSDAQRFGTSELVGEGAGAALLDEGDETDEEMGDEDEVFLTKNEIIASGQRWCTSDYVLGSTGAAGGDAPGGSGRGGSNGRAARGNGGHFTFTPWNGINTLKEHEYVYETRARPFKYCLTAEGMAVARGMAQHAELRRVNKRKVAEAEQAARRALEEKEAAKEAAKQERLAKRKGGVQGQKTTKVGDINALSSDEELALKSPPHPLTLARQRSMPLFSDDDSASASPHAGSSIQPTDLLSRTSASQPLMLGTRPSPPEAAATDTRAAASAARAPASTGLLYTYLTHTGVETLERAGALTRLRDSDFEIVYLIRFPAHLKSRLVSAGLVDAPTADPAVPDTVRAWISRDDSLPLAPGLGDKPYTRPAATPAPSDMIDLLSDSDDATPAAPRPRARPLTSSTSASQAGSSTRPELNVIPAAAPAPAMADGRARATLVLPPARARRKTPQEPIALDDSSDSGDLSIREVTREPSVAPPLGSTFQIVPRSTAPSRATSTESEAESQAPRETGENESQSQAPTLYADFGDGQSQSQSQSQRPGMLLEPQAPYRGLYGDSQRSAPGVNTQATTLPPASDTGSAPHRTGPARRPRARLSNIVPPPAIGISWHNALVPQGEATSRPQEDSSSNRHGLDGPADPEDSRMYHPPEFEPIIWPKGSFDVFLVMDHRETLAKGAAAAQARAVGAAADFETSLRERHGVATLSRALLLGDALWVARDKEDPTREVVLDFICERKRMDDLHSSIRDGRYEEQKFRLSQTGLSHVLYVIEGSIADVRVANTAPVPGAPADAANGALSARKALMTAESELQLLDGYFVEHTADPSRSIEFYARMHKVVVDLVANTDLYELPSEVVGRSSYLSLQTHLRRHEPDRVYLTSYKDHVRLNGKSANKCLRDVWAQMLLSVRGISAEKAAELLDHYSTPHALWHRLREEEADAEQQARHGREERARTAAGGKKAPKPLPTATSIGRTFLQRTVQPPERRRQMGEKLSAKVWDLFMEDG